MQGMLPIHDILFAQVYYRMNREAITGEPLEVAVITVVGAVAIKITVLVGKCLDNRDELVSLDVCIERALQFSVGTDLRHVNGIGQCMLGEVY